jgi:hypothetical protein
MQGVAFIHAAPGENPIVTDRFTADPAPLVVGDTLYFYVGHDEAKGKEMFTMHEWLCYSSEDAKSWTLHGPIMRATDFKWASGDAWAAQVVEKGGKYWFYATVMQRSPRSRAIGVAVSDSPAGPFVDAIGAPLVTDSMTPSLNTWDDIDPTVLIDDDGTPWLSWGNPNCYLVKLKPNMTGLDGPVQRLALPNYTEGPWLHKRNGIYYLTYAAFAHQGFGERICYATASRMSGPWTYRGILTGAAKNSYTIHPGIVEFKNQWYFFYHFAGLTLPDGQTGAIGRRAVCMEYLYYNTDGTIQPITQTREGVGVPPKQPAPYRTEAGVTVVQNTAPGAQKWTGAPVLASMENPRHHAILPTSFNRDGGTTSIGQTFTVGKDIKLDRVTLYAGDGLGTDGKNTVTLALYDLGLASENTAPSETYDISKNLFNNGSGFKIACKVQAPGLLHFGFALEHQVTLKAGRLYALELQGDRNSASLFWRRAGTDTYADGAAYYDRKLMKEKNGNLTDFAFALYETDL